MIIVFIVFFVIWLGVLYFFMQKQDLYRLFAMMMSSVLLYLSFELTLVSYNTPLPIMLAIGLIPIVCVVYGFRVYDYNREQNNEKRKNEDKLKNSDEGALG